MMFPFFGQYAISLGCYDMKRDEQTDVPGISLDSLGDLLHIDPTRVVKVTTRLTMGRSVQGRGLASLWLLFLVP